LLPSLFRLLVAPHRCTSSIVLLRSYSLNDPWRSRRYITTARFHRATLGLIVYVHLHALPLSVLKSLWTIRLLLLFVSTSDRVTLTNNIFYVSLPLHTRVRYSFQY